MLRIESAQRYCKSSMEMEANVAGMETNVAGFLWGIEDGRKCTGFPQEFTCI